MGDELRVCDFAASTDCCRNPSCRRISEFESAGFRYILTRGFQARDGAARPLRALLVLREPSASVLASYEHELHRTGRKHTVELLQYWLARDAVEAVDLWKHHGQSAVSVRMEDLAEDPRRCLESFFSAAGVPASDVEIDRAAQVVRESLPAEGADSLESSPLFARPYFVEHLDLVAAEAEYLGYRPWQEPKPAAGPVTTLYRALQANRQKKYDEVVSLLTPFVGTNAVEKTVRALLGSALLESGRELEGRRAMEVVLRTDPDFLDGYGVLAEHAYELGLNSEARGYLREVSARPGGPAWVSQFLARVKFDPDLERQFSPKHSFPVGRQAVIDGFHWILGRQPETEQVLEDHQHLPSEDALRATLLRSQEFRTFYERFDADAPPPLAGADPAPLSRGQVLTALRWLLGRTTEGREEVDDLLRAQTVPACRHRLIASEEFQRRYQELSEAA